MTREIRSPAKKRKTLRRKESSPSFECPVLTEPKSLVSVPNRLLWLCLRPLPTEPSFFRPSRNSRASAFAAARPYARELRAGTAPPVARFLPQPLPGLGEKGFRKRRKPKNTNQKENENGTEQQHSGLTGK